MEGVCCPSVCRGCRAHWRGRKNCREKSMETCKQISYTQVIDGLIHSFTCTYVHHIAHLHAASHTDKLG